MRIQVFSDIHLELSRTFPQIPPKAKYLFLAGDIGNLEHRKTNFDQFFEYVSENWERTFYVPGNHEFYTTKGTPLDVYLNQYRDYFSKFQNIEFLSRTQTYLEEGGQHYRILGCTLWSDLHRLGAVASHELSRLGDFRAIYDQSSPLTLEAYDRLHQEDCKWLLQSLGLDPRARRTIIMTHFPMVTSHPDRRLGHPVFDNQSDFLKSYFYNDLEDRVSRLTKANPITLAISGHTHFSHDFADKGVRYYSNQFGYSKELGHTGLSDGILEIE